MNAHQRMKQAIQENNLEEIKKLISEPNIQTNLNNFVFDVATWGNEEVAEYFFNLPGVNINTTRAGCISPLKQALFDTNAAAFEVLLNHPDINLNYCNDKGRTLITTALRSNFTIDFLKQLLARREIEIDDLTLDAFVAYDRVKVLLESPVPQSVITRLYVRHPELRRLNTAVLAKRAYNRRRHALRGWGATQAAEADEEDELEAAGGAGAASPKRNTRNNRNGKRNNRRRSTRRARKSRK